MSDKQHNAGLIEAAHQAFLAKANLSSELSAFRKQGWDSFSADGFPTVKNEEWKYTNVAGLGKINFTPQSIEVSSEVKELVKKAKLAKLNATELVFLNGKFCDELSTVKSETGLSVTTLTEYAANNKNDLDMLGKFWDLKDYPFSALNSAFAEDGCYVHVAKGSVIKSPVHLIFVTSAIGSPVLSSPRSYVRLEANSQLSIIESYVGSGDQPYLNNPVFEAELEESALLDHCKIQLEDAQAFHVANIQVHQKRTSNFRSHSLSFGGKLTRNDVCSVLDDEGGECTLNGLYIGKEEQLIDNHTTIDHAKPHCNSYELYRGILDDKSTGVFNGKIFVKPDAQKTDAKQSNNCLLLSDDAKINTKPQLEIFADDVKCTHGATIGQIDDSAVFYFQARGIPKKEALAMLTYAFAGEVVDGVANEVLREELQQLIWHHLPVGK